MDIIEILVNDINEEAAHKFRREVSIMSAMTPDKPITVYIDSSGGDIDALAMMVETLTQVPNDIHTVCIGKAYSAGAFLLSFGDERYCGPYSNIMLHKIQLSEISDMSSEQLELLNKETDKLNKFWLGHVAKNCGMTYKEMNELIKGKEAYFNAKQAKRLGIVDTVGLPKLELIIISKVANNE